MPHDGQVFGPRAALGPFWCEGGCMSASGSWPTGTERTAVYCDGRQDPRPRRNVAQPWAQYCSPCWASVQRFFETEEGDAAPDVRGGAGAPGAMLADAAAQHGDDEEDDAEEDGSGAEDEEGEPGPAAAAAAAPAAAAPAQTPKQATARHNLAVKKHVTVRCTCPRLRAAAVLFPTRGRLRAQSHIRQYLKPILVKVAPSFFARRLRVGPKEKEPTQQAQALFHEAKALKVHSSPISPAPLSSLRRDSLCRAVQALTGKPIWALPPQEVRAEACRGGGAFSQPLLLVLPRSLVHQAGLRPPE